VSVLSIDFETRSTLDLKKTGVYVYAEHQTTDVWCHAWAFDDEEPQIWRPRRREHADHDPSCLTWDCGECRCTCNELPPRVVQHIVFNGTLRAWNAQFERIIWREIMVKRYGAPRIADEQFVCSAAEAAAMALPRSLDQAARVLKVQQQKDEQGYRLMLRMSKPRRMHGTVPEWWDVPDRIARLEEYCKQDVRTERACVRALRRLTPREREIYLLDQRINDRGMRVDRGLVWAATDVASEGLLRANLRLSELTGGAVKGVTNHAALTEWLTDTAELATEGVSKAAIAALLERDDLTADVREVLQLRADAGRTSVAKLRSMVEVACSDGRLRGMLMYHAASTGRWGGRLVQPQNFPRGEVDDPESFIPFVIARDYDALDVFAHPVVIVLSMLRAMLTAAEGHELIAGDFSAIEARVLNWLAGQDDVCALFASGEDVYKHNAAKLYGIPLSEVQKFPHRQTGKFQELGCGFGMGPKKAVSAAKAVYGLTITEEQADEIVSDYRATHSMVKGFWKETENACVRAVRHPGESFRFGAHRNLTAVVAGAYLYIVLPGGRPLCYAGPHLKERPMPWCDVCAKNEQAHVEADHVFRHAKKPCLHYWGVDPFSKQWGEISAYGAMLVENVVQAVARDLMAEAMLRAETHGYTPVLSVHDEIVTEVPLGFGDITEFERLMSELPDWAEGCPVAAEAWRGFRYRK
jgi:DNA polymerase